MVKKAFNKENLVDLFSQLVKVLSRKKDMEEVIKQVRELSSLVFKKAKGNNMSNVKKIAEQIFEEETSSRSFQLSPCVRCEIKTAKGENRFEINIQGAFSSTYTIDQIENNLKSTWRKVYTNL